MEELRPVLHMLLHAVVPLAIARLFAKDQMWTAYLKMMSTMLVDVDHLLADPIYDPDRCSIGFHPLHRFPVMPLYLLMSLFKRTRWFGLGLLIHMALDTIDCYGMGLLPF